jgi:hypothetical protein
MQNIRGLERELPCPKWGRVDRDYSTHISLRFPKRIIEEGLKFVLVVLFLNGI